MQRRLDGIRPVFSQHDGASGIGMQIKGPLLARLRRQFGGVSHREVVERQFVARENQAGVRRRTIGNQLVNLREIGLQPGQTGTPIVGTVLSVGRVPGRVMHEDQRRRELHQELVHD